MITILIFSFLLIAGIIGLILSGRYTGTSSNATHTLSLTSTIIGCIAALIICLTFINRDRDVEVFCQQYSELCTAADNIYTPLEPFIDPYANEDNISTPGDSHSLNVLRDKYSIPELEWTTTSLREGLFSNMMFMNNRIIRERNYVDSPWTGLWHSRKIATLPLLRLKLVGDGQNVPPNDDNK